MKRTLAVLIVAVLPATLAACEPEKVESSPAAAPQQEPPAKKKKKQEEKPAGERQKRKVDAKARKGKKLSLAGVPKLTGDKEKDKRALRIALAGLKTEWDNNKKLLETMTHDPKKKPDAKRIRALKAKNDMYKARAEKLQKLLTQVRGQ
ncbi:MAG: hypothetical protein CMJ83_21510 [Planctomycetes bacterium]|nr:hypothetical protein [Planctomycetota bacterium]